MPSLAHLVGGRRIGKGIDLDLGHTHCTARNQVDDPFEMRAIAPDCGPECCYIAARRDGRRAPDERCATTWAQNRERSLRDLATHGIENGVDAGDDPGEVLRVVVDHFVSAE